MSNAEAMDATEEALAHIKSNGGSGALMEAIRTATATTMSIRVVADAAAAGMDNRRAADLLAITSMLSPLCIAIVAMQAPGGSSAVLSSLTEALCHSIRKNVMAMHEAREAGEERIVEIIDKAIHDATEAAEVFIHGDQSNTTR